MKKEELSFIEGSVLEDFLKFLEAHNIARKVGGYALCSRGTKRSYIIVDKETYYKYTFKPKVNYIRLPLNTNTMNEDIYIGDIEIKVPLYSGSIDLKEFMKEDNIE